MRSRASTFRKIRKISIKPFQLSDPSDFEEMSSIIKKTNLSRSEFEILRLSKTFLEFFPFFDKLQTEASEATISNLIQDIVYEFQPKRKTLFQIGDFGTKFFLILKGSVYVLAREKGLESKKNPEIQSPHLKSGSSLNINEEMVNTLQKSSPLARQQSLKYDKLIEKVHSITKAKHSIIIQELTDEETLLLKYPDLYIDRVLGFGEAFGELALRHKDAKRMATIVCKEDCHFGVISKHVFQRALQAHFDRIMNNNLLFFKKHPLFSEWEELQLEQFYQHINLKNLVKNQVIYQEGEEADFFYLIKEGEIEISKKINQRKEILSKNEEFKVLIMKISKEHKKTLNLRVSLLQNGEIFGLEELIANKKRNYQAICVSGSAILYSIAKQKFLAYANDFKTLAKVLEMKKNIDDFRSEFIDHTINHLESNSLDSDHTLFPIKRPKKRNSEKEKVLDFSREKFDGKLHCLDFKFEKNQKSLDLLKRIDENKSFLENRDIFADFQENKRTKILTSKTKRHSKILNHESYEKILNETKEIYLLKSKPKEKPLFSDIFFSKPRLSFVNFLDYSENQEENIRNNEKKQKLNALAQKTMKKADFSEPYFPEIQKFNHMGKFSNLSLSGNSIKSPFFEKP